MQPETPLLDARRVARMRIELSGFPRPAPSAPAQQCKTASREQQICDIASLPQYSTGAESEAVLERYLAPSLTVQSRDPGIRAAALEAAPASLPGMKRIAGLVAWMDKHIEKAPVDVFSALDVFKQKKAECQGHAYLYAVMARGIGIPTRVVNGLAYSEELKGFLFHSWAESYVEGGWIPVDPTFGQSVADATHIKLLEGETLADLIPLIEWVGRVKIRVLALEHGAP